MIQIVIGSIIMGAVSLNQVPEWPLLAIVAQRCDIPELTKQCRELVSLFCASEQVHVPEKLRGDLSNREWEIVQGLGLVGE